MNVIQRRRLEELEDRKQVTDLEVRDMEMDLCRNDLKYLCKEVLGMSDWDGCHDELAGFLKVSSKRKKLILMPRGHLKSSILTVGLGIQKVLNNFDTTILLANAVWDNARSFLSEIKEYLTLKSDLPRLFGRFESWKWTQEDIVVRQRRRANKTPTFSTAGADKALTSQHYKVIFADDVVNRQTTTTAEQIDKTRKFYSDLLDLLEPDGVMYVIGTRWDSGDIYGTILKDFVDDFDVFQMKATVDGDVEGDVVFPKKFSTQVLKELLRQKGSYEFYAQYFNSCVSPENRIFDPPVRYWEMIPKGSVHCVTVDPAVSVRKESCDAVVIDTCITPSNQLYACEYAIFKERGKHPSRIIEKVFEYVQRFGARVVGIESNGYQEVLCVLMEEEIRKRRMSFQVTPIRQNEDKARRIIGLQPYWERGDLLLKPGMVELAEQFDQFRRPITVKVDILDALAMRLQVDVAQGFYENVAILPDKFRESGYGVSPFRILGA